MAIGYQAAVLDAIRLEVLDGFYAFRHGGLEVGGVLFGTHVDGRVRIAAHRPLECEHAEGPSFALSVKDRDRLTVLLRAHHTDPELRGLVPVGWYHSHTRSGIFLSPQDLQIHDRYFREHWQVALVLRPSIAGTRAGFFALDRAGRLHAEASYREFDLDPLSGRMLAPRAPAPPRAVETPIPEPALPAPLPVSTPPPLWEEPAEQPPNGAEYAPEPEPEPAPQPARLDAPAFLLPEPENRRRRRSLLVLGVFAVLAAGAAGTREHWLPYVPAVPALRLQREVLTAVDSDGQLVIRWDHDSRPVRQALRGALEIVEGPDTAVVMLDPTRLKAGSFTYARRSDRVDVRLKLEQPGGGRVEQYAGFLGAAPPPGSTDAELRRQRDVLAEELREARLHLLNQELLIRRLRVGTGEPPEKAAGPSQAPR